MPKKIANYNPIAAAFLESFHPDKLSPSRAENYLTFCADSSKDGLFRYFLHNQQNNKVDVDAWKAIIKKYDLDASLVELVRYLVSKRLLLSLRKVLESVVRKAEQRGDFMRCTITTSHEPNEDQQKQLLSFLSKKCNTPLIPQFVLDKGLICGIKLRSPFVVAEHSVAQFLRESKKILITE